MISPSDDRDGWDWVEPPSDEDLEAIGRLLASYVIEGSA